MSTEGAAKGTGGGGGSATAATDYRQIYKAMTTPQLVSEAWERETDSKVRDQIVTALMSREAAVGTEGGGAAAWPSAATAARDEMAGLYPDPADPQFAARLFAKREFYEARAVAAGVAEGTIDPCSSAAAERVFELTPVQRIVSRFMHPLTPYMGLLLFHGVGVGKTCTAVTIAEQFLDHAPQHKVIVLVPQALKDNFKRTVFDPDAITWNAAEGHWESRQCTGTSYLERLGLMETADLRTVTYRTEEDKRARYTVTGYQAFANWIERTLKKSLPVSLEGKARKAAEDEILRRIFSDHLIIIDEAHNLRDTAADGVAVVDAMATEAPGGAGAEAKENAAGKALNPFLRRICLNAEGLRLVLMTATPMYNSAPEIVLLLNYLLLNDTKKESAAMRVADLFDKTGELRPGAPQRALERAARRYVSYMRGENPFTFPLRMKPADADADPAALWPEVSATKNPVVLSEQEQAALGALPLVFTEPIAGSPPERVLRAGTSRAAAVAVVASAGEEPVLADGEGVEGGVAEGGAGAEEPRMKDAMLDLRMQMANITYPNEMYGGAGWDNYFTASADRSGDNRLRVFSPQEQPDGPFDVDSVFKGDALRLHAPKLHRVVESIKTAQGICFAYSRYIKGGALPLAVALERAGYQRRLADGRIAPLLRGVPAVAPVCALCGEVNGAGHGSSGPPGHRWQPACYVLLTSEEDISPKFAGLVKQAVTFGGDPEYGAMGSNVKVVIGSQVASEGLNLKCIREMHVIDSWYHLNRIDQIIGRAIRYCSHAALRDVERRLGLPPMSMNNTLIFLHALRVPDFETADMYAYRIAIGKALATGRVQRLLKRHAWDCNLEMEAIVFAGLPPRAQRDAQGIDRRSRDEAGVEMAGYSPNDVDYTTYCDYERCRHECAVTVARTEEEGLHVDTSTFSMSDARRVIMAKQTVVRRLFEDQVMLPETVVQDVFSDLPWEIASEALMELLDGRKFRLTRGDGVEGFLIKKAGYVVFQPAKISDTDIPMTLRYARAFQLRRRFMEPALPVFGRAEEAPVLPPKKAVATAAEAVVAATGEGAAATAVKPPTEVAPVAAVAAAATPAVYAAWVTWVDWVHGDGAAATIPASVGASLKIWSWILERYATVPESRVVAMRWWFDRQNYANQRALLEYTLQHPEDGPLNVTLRSDLLRSKQVLAYRVYNPETLGVEYFCMSTAAAADGFAACDSRFAAIVEKELNKPPVNFMDDTGPLFGFMAGKEGSVVFKTLDKTQPIKPSSVGAECGNTSNLSVHHPRVRVLHTVGRVSDLKDMMLPDGDDDWDAAGADARKKTGRPEHMKDITHQPLCLYMEFLTRILDSRRVNSKRWFLTAAAAATAGLKGKKKKA